ncbi:hypothetical protein JHJ32_12065 [Parapedobacter sp. ISTM3]|uniref:hypothetical protein n=1 Tax=Parapedobacter sp. ISTM3 TaxID=2800130 RepID=UPI00190851E5|nr:hypothetical protein [Parapedobacter sp. ISTM3]MBK1440726.1 hypothetical protein [Parapedobacter sp. ISTM3]
MVRKRLIHFDNAPIGHAHVLRHIQTALQTTDIERAGQEKPPSGHLPLSAADAEAYLLPYAVASVLFGALSIVFGLSLIRLQDGMGELSRVAGILEIIVGCLLVTVVLFFVSYVIMIPAVVMEILILYRGYEYLSKADVAAPTCAS